jgi:WD40 repeat protein
VLHAEFSPDGAYISTAGDDKTARIYLAFRNEQELIALAKRRVTRGLTQAQRIANYLELPVSEGAADTTIPPSPF